MKESRTATDGPRSKESKGGRVSKSVKEEKCENVSTGSSPVQTVCGEAGREVSLDRWSGDIALLPNSLQLENVKHGRRC